MMGVSRQRTTGSSPTRRSVVVVDGFASKPQPAAIQSSILAGFEEPPSPKLIPVDFQEVHNAGPLLPPPAHGSEQEERFCTGGPDISSCGQVRRSDAAAVSNLTLPEVIARLEPAVGQASLLLNDRLRTFQARAQGKVLSAHQVQEIMSITDGVMAAAYHLQKWAFLLQPKGGELRQPTRQGHCESLEEAMALLHVAVPRITFAVAEAGRGLEAALKASGANIERKLRTVGISSLDLRAVGPHLEKIVFRLGSLSSDIRNAPKREDGLGVQASLLEDHRRLDDFGTPGIALG